MGGLKPSDLACPVLCVLMEEVAVPGGQMLGRPVPWLRSSCPHLTLSARVALGNRPEEEQAGAEPLGAWWTTPPAPVLPVQ